MLFKRKRLVNCKWVLLSHSKRHISCHLAFIPSQIWVVVYDTVFICRSRSADPHFLFYPWAHCPQPSSLVIQYPLKLSFQCQQYIPANTENAGEQLWMVKYSLTEMFRKWATIICWMALLECYGKYLNSTYHVSDITARALLLLTHLILPTTLWVEDNYLSFADEETKTQRG